MYIDTQEIVGYSTKDLHDRVEEKVKQDENVGKTQVIRLLSNVTINQFVPWLNLFFLNERVRPEIIVGDFDNILNESYRVEENDIVLIFLELADYQDGVLMRKTEQELRKLGIVENLFNEISLILNNCKPAKRVFFNTPTLARINATLGFTVFKSLETELKQRVETLMTSNVHLVEVDNIIQSIGLANAINTKFYRLNKAPFSNLYYIWYLNQIKPELLNTIGRKKKVIIVDCDNTLWRGIVGEDGVEGIEITAPYRDVQITLKRLSNQGVLLVACSKNNEDDVKEVFDKRDDMILSLEDFTTLKVNWNRKSSNVNDLAEELNLSRDSFLFVDDSEFEINEVKQTLPMVETFHVPKQSHRYFGELSFCLKQFVSSEVLEEDKVRSEMYKAESKRKSEANTFDNYEQYLESLGLHVYFDIDNFTQVKRVAQLTQKTNQFNLTTKRYTEPEVIAMMESKLYSVLSFKVEDRFGDYGIVGVLILKLEDNFGQIDTFLMSCRVLGRGIEKAIFEVALKEFENLGVSKFSAVYRKTAKNNQVSQLYDSLDMELINKSELGKEYQMDIKLARNQKVYHLKYISISRL